MPSRRDGVPAFALYGEADAIADLDFVHIEDIAERSRRHRWEIASHTHRGLYQFVFVRAGATRARLDDFVIDVEPPAVIAIPPSAVHAFRFRAGTEGQVLTVAERLLAPREGADATLLDGLRRGPAVITLPQESGGSGERIAALVREIAREFARPAPGRAAVLDCLLRAVLVLLAREVTPAGRPEPSRGRQDAAFARFRDLVEAHFAAHWSVGRYAAQTGLTETTLNRLCRRHAGRTAFDLVQERLLLEARRRLVYTATSVSQLAYALGFGDPAYFCRFFRRRTGVAPTEFRRRVVDGSAG